MAYELVVGSDERGWMSPTGQPEVYATEAEAEWARKQIASDSADDEHAAEEIAATIRIREVAS